MRKSNTEAYLGLDLGGTGAKAGVFDHSGRMIGFGHGPYNPVVSTEGHVEIPVEDIYNAARHAARQALRKSQAHILAMSVSSQGETFVSLDGKDRPLHKAIIWYDSRAGEQAEKLKNRLLEIRGGLGPVSYIDAICTAPKIMWMRDHFPSLMKRARRFLLLPDYIAYRLTGRAATDSNTAVSTSLYVEPGRGYDHAALEAAGIEEDQLAEILPPGAPIGKVLPSAAVEWGIGADTLLVAGTNDQYAGALGAGNCRPGILSETTGTCQALVTLTRKLPSPLPEGMFGGRFPIQRFQFAMAYSRTAGVVLDWFRRELCAGADFNALTASAAKVPIGSRGLTMLPHFDGIISPNPAPMARGAFCFLTLKHTRGDMYRAILESLAFNLRENVEFFEKHGLRVNVIRSIGGGARNELWLQMKADVTGMIVEKPIVTDAAVLGAAMLAAAGHGDFRSLGESSKRWYRAQRAFEPDPRNRRSYEEPYARYLNLVKHLSGLWANKH